MRKLNQPVIILYGYFLKGSGSGIYVRELTRSLNEIGVNVVLFSQENETSYHDFISASYLVKGGRLELLFERNTDFPGKTVHVKPDLRGFLPVYVYDPYPGYSVVKEFKDITEEEVEKYLSCIEEAAKLSSLDLFKNPIGVISNHLAPLPAAAKRIFKDIPHLVVFHGSDLNYGIRKSPLVEKYFWEGIEGSKVITLTAHGKKDFLSFTGMRFSEASVLIIHPGVDTFKFRPREDWEGTRNELIEKIKELFVDARISRSCLKREKLVDKVKHEVDVDSLKVLYRKIDVYEAEKLTEIGLIEFLKNLKQSNKLFTFAGKYLWTKGPEAVVLASPLIFRRFPEAKIVLVGLGSSRGILESIKEAIASKDVKRLKLLLESHYEIDPGSIQKLSLDPAYDFIETFLEDPASTRDYLSSIDSQKIRNDVFFAGYLDHSRLCLLLSLTDVFFAPSVYLESFGLVAIEAAASGAVPVITAAYGFGDTDEVLRYSVPELRSLPKLTLEKGFVSRLAQVGCEALKLPTRDFNFRLRLHDFTEKEFSWKSAATKIAEHLKGAKAQI